MFSCADDRISPDVKRIATGLVLAVGWVALVRYGSFQLFWAILTAIGGIALYEYVAIVLAEESQPFRALSLGIGLFPVVGAYCRSLEMVTVSLFLALTFMTLVAVTQYARLNDAFEFMLRTAFGVFYVGFCVAHIVLIAGTENGSAWLLLLTAITVASDSGAYYSGRLTGKNKLCPAVSPGKTWEGAVGGLVFSVLGGLLGAMFFLPDAQAMAIVTASLVLSAIGALGDLAESVLKRSAAVKDSGQLLPGHGGLLDRGDSMLFGAPVLFYLLHFGLL